MPEPSIEVLGCFLAFSSDLVDQLKIRQSPVMPTSVDTYRVTLDFESQGERLYFDWDVDTAAGAGRGNNDITKDVIDVVDFYD